MPKFEFSGYGERFWDRNRYRETHESHSFGKLCGICDLQVTGQVCPVGTRCAMQFRYDSIPKIASPCSDHLALEWRVIRQVRLTVSPTAARELPHVDPKDMRSRTIHRQPVPSFCQGRRLQEGSPCPHIESPCVCV